jgi:hypothetical protein
MVAGGAADGHPRGAPAWRRWTSAACTLVGDAWGSAQASSSGTISLGSTKAMTICEVPVGALVPRTGDDPKIEDRPLSWLSYRTRKVRMTAVPKTKAEPCSLPAFASTV